MEASSFGNGSMG